MRISHLSRGWQTMAHEPHSAHCLLLYGSQAENGFTVLSGYKKKKDFQNDMLLKIYEVQISVSISNGVLERGHTHLVTYCLWLLLYFE